MKNKLFLGVVVFGLFLLIASPQVARADNDGDSDNDRMGMMRDSDGDRDSDRDGDNDQDDNDDDQDDNDNDNDDDRKNRLRKEENHREYMKKLQEEHREDTEDHRELRTQLKEKKQELKMKTSRVKTKLMQKADFSLDPTTDKVMVVTRSGEEHELNHLPDQAIERMKAAGFFEDDDLNDEEELEVETGDDGKLVYRKRDKVKKKLFGLFTREVDSEIVLDDSTGEVTEHEAAPGSFWGRMLNRFSF